MRIQRSRIASAKAACAAGSSMAQTRWTVPSASVSSASGGPCGASAAWAALAPQGPPDAELTDAEGTVHRVWAIDDPAAHAAFAEAMRERWILIADGHH